MKLTITTSSNRQFQSTPTELPQLYRVLHDGEMGPLWRFSVPEVFPLTPLHLIPLDREWQLFTKDLNPSMSREKWRILYGWATAFTNHEYGFDYPQAEEPLQDWVNMKDIDAPGLPTFDKPRLCGGALVTGREEAGFLWIEYLDATQPPPKADDVPIWLKFCATTVRKTASGTQAVGRFPQGGGADVWVPIISRQPIKYPLNKLEKLAQGAPLPDPYKLHLPQKK